MVKRTKLRSFAHVYLLYGGNLHRGIFVHEKAQFMLRAPSRSQSISLPLLARYFCLPVYLIPAFLLPDNRRAGPEQLWSPFCLV